MYSIAGFGKMIADEVRIDAYSRALQRVIGPDSVVLDIGAGTGIFSLLACQYGARKVFAVEPSSAIGLAEEAARANGFADRIKCFEALSTNVELPERVDVVVSDLRGVLPLFGQHINSIIDARQRFLEPSGTLIPKQDRLWGALVEAPEHHDGLLKPWARFELNMEAASTVVTNQWKKVRVTPEQLLTEAHNVSVIDYLTVASPHLFKEMTLRVERSGTAHGFVMWFDALLAHGIEFSNAPGRDELIYGSAFFPLSYPVSVEAGDTASVTLRADLVGSDYTWSWETRVNGHDLTRLKAHFRQSTFLGTPLSQAKLRRWGDGNRPVLSEEGLIDLEILQLMDGTRRNKDIAQYVMQEFPSSFEHEREALTRIACLTEKYSQ